MNEQALLQDARRYLAMSTSAAAIVVDLPGREPR